MISMFWFVNFSIPPWLILFFIQSSRSVPSLGFKQTVKARVGDKCLFALVIKTFTGTTPYHILLTHMYCIRQEHCSGFYYCTKQLRWWLFYLMINFILRDSMCLCSCIWLNFEKGGSLDFRLKTTNLQAWKRQTMWIEVPFVRKQCHNRSPWATSRTFHPEVWCPFHLH